MNNKLITNSTELLVAEYSNHLASLSPEWSHEAQQHHWKAQLVPSQYYLSYTGVVQRQPVKRLVLRFKIVSNLSSACLLPHLSASDLSRLGGPVFSFYPINMAARACHQYEIETQGQSRLKGLDDWWMVLHCFYAFFEYKGRAS